MGFQLTPRAPKIWTNAYASAPSGAADGDTWYPSDSVGVYFLRVGGAWVGRYAGGIPVADPSLQSWSWVNQTSGSVTAAIASPGGSQVLTTGPVSGNNVRARVMTAPATPYTITALILPRMYPTNFATGGICWRESSSGKLVTFGLVNDGTAGQLPALYWQKWTNPTTFSSSVAGVSALWWVYSAALWLRIADNGTNRICSVSMDGYSWLPLYTIGRTDFCTPDQVGFWLNAGQATAELALTVLSWAIS